MPYLVGDLLAHSRRESNRARLRVAVAEELALRMEALAVTKAEMAQRLGVANSVIERAIAGDRNMTLNTLADIADERARDPDAPPLGPELSELLRAARAAAGSQQPFPPIDRRALHRYLDELALREERHR